MSITTQDQELANLLSIKDSELEQKDKDINTLKFRLMISGKGGSPYQPYDNPEDGKGPFVPPPKQKLARANNIRSFQDKGWQLNIPLHDWKQIPPGIKNDPDFINLHLRRMQADGTHFDEYGRPIQDPTEGMDPSGNPITIPHLKQTPEESEKNKQLHIQKYHQANASSRQIRDRLKPFTHGTGYDKEGGSLRGIPNRLRIQLLRDAMAQNLPANNIRRLQDTGHMTIPQNADGTGPLRIIDLLGPQNPPQA